MTTKRSAKPLGIQLGRPSRAVNSLASPLTGADLHLDL